MPIYNWLKWHEDKDDKWLSKKGKAGLLTSYFGNQVMTQFIDRFGFSETFIKALEKEKEKTWKSHKYFQPRSQAELGVTRPGIVAENMFLITCVQI